MAISFPVLVRPIEHVIANLVEILMIIEKQQFIEMLIEYLQGQHNYK
jgi:hypothetical protein